MRARIGFRTAVAAVLLSLPASSCGSPPAPHATATPSPSRSSAPLPSAAAGPCASVLTTTAIADVPAACAAVWAPYGVTKVPPANLTDSTPVPPVVVNETGGAVSDADAKAWAQAANRNALWYQWAEANIQPALLMHLGPTMLDPPAELQALAAGTAVLQPSCGVFPTSIKLFPVSSAAKQFFAGLGEAVASAYALVATFAPNCVVTGLTPSGQKVAIASYPSATISFFPGQTLVDSVLGKIWINDGAGNCTDAGAPTEWCS